MTRLFYFFTVFNPIFLAAADLSLQELLQTAEQNSPFIEAKMLQMQASGYQTEQAGLWGNPQLQGELGGIQQNDIGGFAYSLRITQPIAFPGKLGARMEFQKFNQRIDSLDLLDRRQSIAFNVVTGAYSLNTAAELLHYFAARLERFKTLRIAIAARPSVSPEIQAQKLIVENALRNAERDFLNIQKETELARERLSLYIGDQAAKTIATPYFLTPTLIEKQEIQSKTMAQNILLQRLAAQVNQTYAQSRLLKREAYPDVNFIAYFDKDTGPFLEHRFGAGLSAPIPVFNRNQHAIKAAAAYTASLEKEKRFAEDTLRRDFNMLYREYLTARAMLEKFPLSERERLSSKIKTLTRELIKGRITILSFADMEQRSHDTIMSAFTVQLSYVTAVARLYSLAGDAARLSEVLR